MRYAVHSLVYRYLPCCSEEKHRFSAFNGPLASKRRVLSTAFTPSEDSDTASFGCLHLLSHSPLALHSFLGVDVPPGVSLPHAQTQRVMDLSWALLPASMGGLVKARKGSNGYGSVYKNEVLSCLC